MAKKAVNTKPYPATEWLDGLTEAMQFHADPERAVQMALYMKNKFPFAGISQPIRKALSRPFIKETKTWEIDAVLKQARALWKKPEREYQYIAMELLYACRKKWNHKSLDFFLGLVTEKSWWDTVDFIASRLIGESLMRDREWAIMEQWVHAENIWQNRTALLFQLNYKKETDQEFLFNTIRTLQPRKEFFIQKAIGWALRQYHRVEPEAVEQFVGEIGLTGLARREALKHA